VKTRPTTVTAREYQTKYGARFATVAQFRALRSKYWPHEGAKQKAKKKK